MPFFRFCSKVLISTSVYPNWKHKETGWRDWEVADVVSWFKGDAGTLGWILLGLLSPLLIEWSWWPWRCRLVTRRREPSAFKRNADGGDFRMRWWLLGASTRVLNEKWSSEQTSQTLYLWLDYKSVGRCIQEFWREINGLLYLRGLLLLQVYRRHDDDKKK